MARKWLPPSTGSPRRGSSTDSFRMDTGHANVQALLEEGAAVCDVGCGRGLLITLAEAFPRGRFVGLDAYEPAIRGARAKAQNAEVQDRVRFEVADAAAGLQGGSTSSLHST